jgi:CDGSH-type Zn-finger protein
MEARSDARATITPYEDGPLLVRGDFELLTQQGEVIPTDRGTVALCRCGLSAIKPLCDGTHKVGRFRAPGGQVPAKQ